MSIIRCTSIGLKSLSKLKPLKTVSYDKVIQACIHRVKKMSAERDWKYSEDEHLKHQITKVYLEELRTHDLPAKFVCYARGCY